MNVATFGPHSRAFIHSVLDGGFDDARAVLARHPELIDERNSSRETPLHYLAIEGAEDGVRMLLDAGAEADPRDRSGHTPLSDCAGLELCNVCRLLLERGADPQAVVDFLQETPLHTAARHTPDADVIDLLVRHGADIRARNKSADTPLHEAAYMSNIGAARRLIELGAPLDVSNEWGETPAARLDEHAPQQLRELFFR